MTDPIAMFEVPGERLTAMTNDITELRRLVADKDAEIADRDRMIRALAEQAGTLTAQAGMLRLTLADKDAEIARLTAELDSMRDVPVEYVTEAGLEAAMTADPGRQDGTVLRETNGARRAFEWHAKTGEWARIT